MPALDAVLLDAPGFSSSSTSVDSRRRSIRPCVSLTRSTADLAFDFGAAAGRAVTAFFLGTHSKSLSASLSPSSLSSSDAAGLDAFFALTVRLRAVAARLLAGPSSAPSSCGRLGRVGRPARVRLDTGEPLMLAALDWVKRAVGLARTGSTPLRCGRFLAMSADEVVGDVDCAVAEVTACGLSGYRNKI